MTGPFDDLFRLDLDAHVRRWSAPDAGRVDGDVTQWMAAAQQFAARVQADPGGLTGLTHERWREIGQAWVALLAAASGRPGRNATNGCGICTCVLAADAGWRDG